MLTSRLQSAMEMWLKHVPQMTGMGARGSLGGNVKPFYYLACIRSAILMHSGGTFIDLPTPMLPFLSA